MSSENAKTEEKRHQDYEWTQRYGNKLRFYILSRPLNVAGPEAAAALVSDGSVVVLGAGTCGQ
jgi:hypothetical protein